MLPVITAAMLDSLSHAQLHKHLEPEGLQMTKQDSWDIWTLMWRLLKGSGVSVFPQMSQFPWHKPSPFKSGQDSFSFVNGRFLKCIFIVSLFMTAAAYFWLTNLKDWTVQSNSGSVIWWVKPVHAKQTNSSLKNRPNWVQTTADHHTSLILINSACRFTQLFYIKLWWKFYVKGKETDTRWQKQ